MCKRLSLLLVLLVTSGGLVGWYTIDPNAGENDFTYKYEVTRIDDDYDNNRSIDYTYNFFYNDTSQLVKWERWNFEKDNNGKKDWVASFYYNSDGKQNRVESDVNQTDGSVDGIIDGLWRYYYNAEGKMERSDFDKDNNGVVDAVTYNYYNADGKRERVEEDTDGNGLIEKITHYYNSNGKLDRYGADYDNYTYQYYYNNDGRLDRMESRTLGTKKYFYDAAGKVLKCEESYQGKIDLVSYYYYDSNNNDDGTNDPSESTPTGGDSGGGGGGGGCFINSAI